MPAGAVGENNEWQQTSCTLQLHYQTGARHYIAMCVFVCQQLSREVRRTMFDLHLVHFFSFAGRTMYMHLPLKIYVISLQHERCKRTHHYSICFTYIYIISDLLSWALATSITSTVHLKDGSTGELCVLYTNRLKGSSEREGKSWDLIQYTMINASLYLVNWRLYI